jgi:hypothetical protein
MNTLANRTTVPRGESLGRDAAGVVAGGRDAWCARAYGLTRDELRHILDPADVHGPDFPGKLPRGQGKETAKCGGYRTSRLVLEESDKLPVNRTLINHNGKN